MHRNVFLVGALLVAKGEPVSALVPGPLPARPVGDVALEDLQAFFAHPVRAFLRARLDVSSPLEAEETRDAMPISLEGLEKWQIGDRLLAAVLGGTDPAMSVRAERLRGVLPPGALGSRTLREVEEQVRPLGGRHACVLYRFGHIQQCLVLF